ncbi:MAG: phenylacetate--CoA ligase family protein [Lachnospiraceae bacterium]|nr:phenylacetate--CoA ligase family protein [Lachnospiraceae bacterium]
MGRLHLLWDLYQLKRNEYKTREQIRTLQDKKLRKLLYYAYDHSTYYKRTFEQAGITREQIRKLPISAFPTIDKKILMEHFDEIVTREDIMQEELRMFDEGSSTEQKEFRGKYHVVHSSGSTGIPRYFVYDTPAWNQMLLGIIRGALWDMTMPGILKLLSGRPRILYVAATDGRYGGAMAVGDGIDGVGAEQMFLDIKTPLSQWIYSVKEFQPDMIIGYPSAIKILGELIERSEVSVNVRRVISCGEPLSPGLRNYLEQVFRTVVVNFYGASESLVLGVETNPAEGMYLFDDMNYIEVENGKMYLTSLYNFAQPLIRYRISDQLTLMQSDSMSRCPFLQANILLSRNEDVLWFEDPEGKRDFLHPLAVEGLCVEGLLDYQFRQTDKDAFEMLAEVSTSEREAHVRGEILKQMERILHEKNLDNVRFFVKFVEEILPDSRTGKKQLIVQYNEG